jgi:tetratricopeptide (TPR) repeat protein/predicted Ser/Thr protein kinase
LSLVVSGSQSTPKLVIATLEEKRVMSAVERGLFGTPTDPVRVGRFDILDRIGEGGMGVVYAAYDPELERRVAIKVLSSDREGESRASERLRREAQAMARLSHPNVVDVFDVGMVDGRVFFAMEYIEGETLTEWAARRPRGWREVIDVLVQAGRGLAAAHADGLVHRDFKPDNVMIDQEGRVRVLDFGLVGVPRAADPDDAAGARRERDAIGEESLTGRPLTRDGAIVGTPAYMSPEQLLGADVGPASDQFSYCVSVYELVYGERPFAGDIPLAPAARDVRPPPKDCDAPAWLRRVLLRGLAENPAQRHADMTELLDALRRAPGRRGRLAILGIGLGGLVAAAWVMASSERAAASCSTVGDDLSGTWDDTVRAEIERALLATGAPYASDTAVKVSADFDTFTTRWATMRRQTCESLARGDVDTTLVDTQMACLDRQLRDARALTEVLREVDAEAMARVVTVVGALPQVHECAEAALSRTEAPPPGPAVQPQVERIRGQLTRAARLGDAGRYADGLALVGEMMPQARSTEYAPVVAQAEIVRGELLSATGAYAEAERSLLGAYFSASDAQAVELAAAAAISLVRVTGTHLDEHQEAHEWARHAQAALERLGVERPGLTAALSSNLGSVLEAQGDYRAAAQRQRVAIEIQERALGPSHPAVAQSLSELGGILRRLGDDDAALAAHDRALAIREESFGPRHPVVAQSLNNLGLVLKGQGRFEEADAYYRRALSIREDALGRDHPAVATSLNNRAAVLAAWGRYDEALAEHRRALAIRIAHFGRESTDVALSLQNIGDVLDLQGEYAAAADNHRRALAMVEHVLGPRHPRVAIALGELGTTVDHQGRYAEALQLHRRALSISTESLGREHPRTATALNGVGKALRKLGDFEAAAQAHREALAIQTASLGPEHLSVATSHNDLGLALKYLSQPDDAMHHYERARAIREKHLGREHPDVATVLNNIGALRTEQEDYVAAVDLHLRALAIRRAALAVDPSDIATSEHNLGVALEGSGRHRDAVEHLQRALRSREAVDPEHPRVAITLDALASSLVQLGRYDEAMTMYRRALAIQSATLPADHPRIADTRQHLEVAESER